MKNRLAFRGEWGEGEKGKKERKEKEKTNPKPEERNKIR
jgi:hypothetical protein